MYYFFLKKLPLLDHDSKTLLGKEELQALLNDSERLLDVYWQIGVRKLIILLVCMHLYMCVIVCVTCFSRVRSEPFAKRGKVIIYSR